MTRSQVEHQAELDDLARLADQRSPGLVREYFDFLGTNKNWWLTPISLALLLVGLIVILGSTAAGPFIYTLF